MSRLSSNAVAQFLRQLITETRSATEDESVGVVIYLGRKYNSAPAEFKITIVGGNYGEETDVKGVDFEEMLSEYRRRKGFDQRQKHALLSGPAVVEAECEVVPEAPDEMQF